MRTLAITQNITVDGSIEMLGDWFNPQGQVDSSDRLVRRPAEKVRALKEKPGRDIVITGGITLCHTLIEAGLVDEYRLFVYPVVQGRGRRLFPDGLSCLQLRLLEAMTFRSGITYSRYTPA